MIYLPPGVIAVSSEMTLARGAHDLTLVGSNTTLKASDRFQGRAILCGEEVKHIRLVNFSVDGNRAALAKPLEMAPPENQFRIYYPDNGVLFDRAESIEISGVRFSHIVNFAVLVSRSVGIGLDHLHVEDSGSLNKLGRNNTTGGVVIEEGSSGFEVRDCTFLRIRGNALWTHSMYRSPRLRDGLFQSNDFDTVGRDAMEVGHATAVRVVDNTGDHIGYPAEIVDVENGGTPVAIDTAGNVDHTVYAHNRFEEIDGKCIDLDGFHDGSVLENQCVNRKTAAEYPFGHFGIVMNNANPDMRSENIEILNNRIDGTKLGGLFMIGSGHRVIGNTFTHLNEAQCNENAKVFGCIFKSDEPEMLEAGIYLGRGAERPADTHGNLIRGNLISGHKMKTRCIISAPGLPKGSNEIAENRCADQ
ncbi:MAG: right-handed parallel beta-helix repeat-containing protein [Bryobacteraceae bacterium]